jgi:hypothetical protein
MLVVVIPFAEVTKPFIQLFVTYIHIHELNSEMPVVFVQLALYIMVFVQLALDIVFFVI